MTFLSKAGSFSTGTGTSNIVVTGVGFQPKVLILHTSGRSELVDTCGGQSIILAYGFASSPTSRRSVGITDLDGLATTAGGLYLSNEACLITPDSLGAISGALDLVSFDTDGFTLAVDDFFPASIRVGYLALGGTDITDVTTGQFTYPLTTGQYSISDVGFRPDVLFFLGGHRTAIAPPVGNNNRATIHFGAAISSSKMGVIANSSDDNVATADTTSYCRTGECIVDLDASNPYLSEYRHTLVSMDANGFTLDCLEASPNPLNYYEFYLAIKGGNWDLGSVQSSSTPNDTITVSNLSFRPSALMFVSAARPETVADTPTTRLHNSLGLASDVSSQLAQAVFSDDLTADSETASAIEYDNVYINISESDLVQGSAALSAIGSTGFTLTMTDADPAQNLIWFVVAGPTGGGSTTYTITPSGSLVSSGSLVRVTQKTHRGSIGASGSLVKRAMKALGGLFTPAGVLRRSTSKYLSGILTSVGAPAFIRAVIRIFSGSLTPRGSTTKLIGKGYTGTIGFTGVIRKQLSRIFAGAILPSGALVTVRAILRSFSGSISGSGSLQKRTSKSVGGTLSGTGTVSKLITKSFTGLITALGALVTHLIPPGGSSVVHPSRDYLISLDDREYLPSSDDREFEVD